MEHLSKQQLVLLAILISFVTSMATGIVTVSLMDQAPRSVTQTINRVVEKTIETVVPENSGNTNTASVVTRETVVVRADDLVVEAIEKNNKNLVRIFRTKQDLSDSKSVFVGLALITQYGLVADKSLVEKQIDSFGAVIPETYEGFLFDGSKVSLLPVEGRGGEKLVIFEKKGEDGKPAGVNFGVTKIEFGKADKLKLGQSVVQIGGKEDSAVATGIVALLKKDQAGLVKEIVTDIRRSDRALGMILSNLSGEIVGFLTSDMPDGSFLPIEVVIEHIATKDSPNR